MDLIEFLTSKEIIVVYIVAAAACLLCFIIYLVERNNQKARQRHNTKELNKLVEQIKEEVPEKVVVENKEPVLQVIEPVTETIEEEVIEPVEKIKEEKVEVIDPVIEEEPKLEVKEELEYTTIEPDPQTARIELKKITEELKRQEELEATGNIPLTNYEEQQEATAIISLEELVKKSKEMYEANELTQYKDEGNEPISIKELETKVGKETTKIEDTFVIENVVPQEEVQEIKEEPVLRQVTIEDLNTTKEVNKVEEDKKFRSSPIISPIYGIREEETKNIELENTADYDKLDAEIKKTNEFLMTLKELQQKLD